MARADVRRGAAQGSLADFPLAGAPRACPKARIFESAAGGRGCRGHAIVIIGILWGAP